jgi:recombinational DNA repair protein RecR
MKYGAKIYQYFTEHGLNTEDIKNFIPDLSNAHIEKARNRKNICHSCDKYDTRTKMCSICHCWIPTKTLWPDTKCPLDKW